MKNLRLCDVMEGRLLSAEDIVHYGKVVSALGETIRVMREVDDVIEVNGGWAIK